MHYLFICLFFFAQKYIGEFIKREYQLERSEEYYFDHSDDYIIDATHQGNKTRYLNHSLTPNIKARNRFVNGEKRIAFYAKQDVPAQSEVRSKSVLIFLVVSLALFSRLLCLSTASP